MKASVIAIPLATAAIIFSCKSNPGEQSVNPKAPVHGINDQVITGRFSGVNSIGIVHNIVVDRLSQDQYRIFFYSDPNNTELSYRWNTAGSFNGYALMVPVQYNAATDSVYLSFNAEKLQLSFEKGSATPLADIGKQNNALPRIYYHEETKPVSDPDLPLAEICRYENRYPDDAFLKTEPLRKRLQQLLGGTLYNKFTNNFKADMPLIQLRQGVFYTANCRDEKCADVGSELFIDIPNDNIQVKQDGNSSLTLYEKQPISR